jgi:hypothetical protein
MVSSSVSPESAKSLIIDALIAVREHVFESIFGAKAAKIAEAKESSSSSISKEERSEAMDCLLHKLPADIRAEPVFTTKYNISQM